MKRIVFTLIGLAFLVSACSQYTCATYAKKTDHKSKVSLTKETRF